jgi:hypothetical protein
MNKEQKPYNIEYTFHIQSAEDFYNQLRAFHREDYAREQEIDVDNLELAQSMLKGIGINV